ncbi:MAG: peptidase [Bacilli bacterium]|nr:peptidase [Bacilli bacterium]
MGSLESYLYYPVSDIPFVFLVLMIAFTLHEFAHAYMADKFGDPTPRSMGRVTLNPQVHLDVFGTILIFIAGLGWAKPVMVNRSNFKNPRLMGIIVSAVGPLSNLFVAFIGVFIYYLIPYFHLYSGMNQGLHDAIQIFLGYLISLNMTLFLFNLLPLPPLDGYRILQDLLPVNYKLKIQEYEQWAIYVFILIMIVPGLNRAILGPIFALGNPILKLFSSIMITIFGHIQL